MEKSDLSFDELKETGNKCIKEKRYEDALECYSSALKLRSTEHTVFSNRSLAYLRLGKLEDAFSDACRCVEICPEFARGHMRKAVALNMLRRYEEARKASVAGYLLRGSDSISKECISQWLTATKMLFDDYYKSGNLPTGAVILSDAYFVTLFQVLTSRSSSLGMSSEKMEECLLEVASQMREVLATFGHSVSDSLQDWVKALGRSSLEVDPRTSTLPKGTLESAVRKSEALAEWVKRDIDSILYPIIRPLLILAVMVVLSRTYILNCMNLGHENIQVLSQACLVLFEQSILNTSEFLGHHLGTIAGLLDSFLGRGTNLTREDTKVMEHYCIKAEELLPLYIATEAWEKEQLKDIVIRVIANVRSELRMKSTGMFAQSQALPQESMMSGEVAKRDALKQPVEVQDYMEKLVKEVKAKGPTELFLRDGEHLVHGSVGLMKLQQSQKALEAFALGEQVHFTVFACQARTKLWSLEDAPAMISTSRNDLLLTALALRELDPSLLPGVLVRWKCLFSEFRTLLMYFGLKNHFARTFMCIDSLRRSGQVMKAEGAKNLASVMQQYQEDQKVILEKWGAHLMLLLSQQSPGMIQKVLEPKEAVLEIAVVANPSTTDVDRPGRIEGTGILLLILPQGEPVAEVVDFDTLITLSKEWPKKLNEVIVGPPSDTARQAKHQQEADELGKKIREILFPATIEAVINSGQVDCLYLCPDLTLGNLPLDLLPWADGKYLFEKCCVSYLSSSREALREWCVQAVRQNFKVDSNQTGQAHEEAPAAECNPVTNSVSTECLLFADPDYDMEVDASEEGSVSFWEVLKESFGLSPQSDQKMRVKSLPKSLDEAEKVKQLLSLPENGVLKSRIISGKNATLLQTIQVKSPLVLHFSTHGFSQPGGGSMYGGNFWTDMTTGLALAGINTYRFGKTTKISPAAGTGELTAMAACGMDLKHTRLVYLSTCVSSIGFTTAGESVGSLAQAFRAAGAETVVATLWPVIDEAARKFAIHFYEALCRRGTKPAQAIVEAKQKVRQETGFEHWYCWGPFVCIGYNFPLLLPNVL